MPNLLQSQLSFFGAIDNAVVYAQQGGGERPEEVLRTVEALLPGTTGFGQAGWYRELELFANLPELQVGDVREAFEFPSLDAALDDLEASAEAAGGVVAAAVDSGRDALPTASQDPALARSAYAAMILAKIGQLNGFPPDLTVRRTIPARIIASAINIWMGSPTTSTRGQAPSDPTVRSLLDQLDEVDSPESWVSRAAAQVDPRFAEQSVPHFSIDPGGSCFGKLDNIEGQYVSTLYTDVEDKSLGVKDIEKILDPRNWSICCDFFHAVDAQDPPYTGAGWSRILEKISPQPEKWCLSTALVFYYGRDDADGIFLNYDLDPNRQGDSGIVEVDKGYIWATPTKPGARKGVRIRTSKQERVQGLSPTATSALGALLGWGDAAYKLLAGTADVVIRKKVPPGHKVFPFELTPPTGWKSKADKSDPPAKRDVPPTLPPNFGSAVADYRDLLNDLINRTRDVGADAADRWMDGLTRDDVDQITKDVGVNLNEFALEVYSTAEASVKPKDITTTAKGRP